MEIKVGYIDPSLLDVNFSYCEVLFKISLQINECYYCSAIYTLYIGLKSLCICY